MTTPTESPTRYPRKGEAAVSLRLAGATYEEIAEALGYANEAVALKAVEVTLSKTASAEDKGKMRTVAAMRYERLIRSVWVKATDPTHPEQLAAVRSARELIDRYVALQGLAVPQELIVRTPSQAELEQWVAQVSRFQAPDVEEADIIDVEPLAITGETDPTEGA